MASIQELGPRQRMINMMYIIFISMLALNMSKEVLKAFGDVNDSLKTSIDQTQKRNNSLMLGLAEKAQDQPEKYKPLQKKAQKIQQESKDLLAYISDLKGGLIEGIERDENGELKYRQMDNDWKINQTFFANNKLTEKGEQLIAKIEQFRGSAIDLASSMGNAKLAEGIAKKFNTDPVKTAEGTKISWIRSNFEGFPLIAGITKLTNIQSNVTQTQSELLTSLVSGQMSSDLSMTNYKAIVTLDKAAFFAGEKVTGKVVLGRYDNSLSFSNVIINGNEVENTQAGQVMLNFTAGNVGDHKITGKLQFSEGDSVVTIPVESSYTVIPKPNSAVISADKMNVVYRGVNNPLTISIPGVPNVSASAPGMRHTGGANYMLNPTNIRSHEVTINVSGTLPNGESVSDSKVFRIKEIPSPIGTVRSQTGGGSPIRMQRSGLKVSSIGAKLPNFVFDLNIVVSGFKLQVPGKPIVQVNGTRMNAAAKRAISSAPRGSTVLIFDIKAHIAGNSSYHLASVPPVTVQLTD